MPLPFCAAAILAGLALMTLTRRARLGRSILVAGVGLLLLFGNHQVSRALVCPLEKRYATVPELEASAPVPATLARCRFVVVLGAGNGNGPGFAALHRLSSSALARVVEAVRLLRFLPEAKLIVSGPASAKHPAHATVLARAAHSLGIEESRIVLIDQARDTEEEARRVHERVGEEPIALVTSAWHMPRAVALFQGAGVSVLPCPVDFSIHEEEEVFFWHWLWDSQSLQRSTIAIHERLGHLWAWLRRKT
ncbi:MAG: ElyC/SanA/YdcF family protein [Opitutaceae bacterium]